MRSRVSTRLELSDEITLRNQHFIVICNENREMPQCFALRFIIQLLMQANPNLLKQLIDTFFGIFSKPPSLRGGTEADGGSESTEIYAGILNF